MAAAAALVAASDGLAEQIPACLVEMPPGPAVSALRSLLTLRGSGYWRDHSDFGRPLARPAGLIGTDRAADLAVNVALPWALALARHNNDAQLETAVQAVYAVFPPLSTNQLTRHMTSQILGESAYRLRSACLQQGLIQLYRGWCDDRNCVDCPAGQHAARHW